MAKHPDPESCRVVHPREDRQLADCFVPPDILSRLLDLRSTIVAAPAGYGKSALAAISQTRLSTAWLDVSFDIWQSPAATESERLDHLFDAVAKRAWGHVQDHPEALARLESRGAALKHFLRHYLGIDLDYQLEMLADDHPLHAQAILAFRRVPERELFTTAATETDRLTMLCDCVVKLGFEGIMIWIDQPGALALSAEDTQFLAQLFDSLNMMRKRLMHFKCLTARETARWLAKTRGVTTGSVDVLDLAWQPEQLRDIVDRRLQAASDDPTLSLQEYVPVEDFRLFLQNWSDAGSPAEWMTLARIVLAKIAGGSGPEAACWLKARQQYCAERLKIRMDGDGTFWRGTRHIEGLQPRKRAIYPLVRYLYEHPGFHLPYRLADELETDITSLNTNIHRARRDYVEPIFPDAKFTSEDCIYLVTDPKGSGYGLLHTDKTP